MAKARTADQKQWLQEVGKRLRVARTEIMHWTQQKAAAQLKCGQSLIAKFEGGDCDPTLNRAPEKSQLQRLADLYGVDHRWLLGEVCGWCGEKHKPGSDIEKRHLDRLRQRGIQNSRIISQ